MIKLNQIITGNARELAKDIPDNSVDLIFTDPIYWNIEDYEWLAEMAARVLKPNKSVLCYIAHHREIEVGIAMSGKGLESCPVLQDEVYNRVPGRMFAYSLQCNLMPLVWFSKGKPDNQWMYIQASNPMVGGRHFKWGKNLPAIGYRIHKFTSEGETVFDPFSGGATVPAVCKMQNRNFIAFEIDPETAELARDRISKTQPQLPLIVPRQQEMGF